MFGSIATPPSNKSSENKSVVDRPPSNPTDPKDPWDDTSLIQFWQQATESYKLHHSDTPKTHPSTDPLLERKKRLEETSQVDQRPSKKQKNLDSIKKTSLTTKTSAAASSSPTDYIINRTDMQKETDGDQELDGINDTKQTSESENVDATKENEYDAVDESENMDANKENRYTYVPEDGEEGYQDYDYAQDPDEENQDYQGYYDYDYQQNPQYHEYYQHHQQQQQPQFQSAPPPPPPMSGLQGNEALTNMIMAWYYSGYYTGLYQAQQQR